MPKVLSLEENAEHLRLFNQFNEAAVRAGKIAEAHGMGSPEFLEADSATGAIIRQIRKLTGDTPSHWMA
jgi:hypothetical protein